MDPSAQGFVILVSFFAVSQLIYDVCEIKRETSLAFSQMEFAVKDVCAVMLRSPARQVMLPTCLWAAPFKRLT